MNLITLIRNWKECVSRCNLNRSEELLLRCTTGTIWAIIQPFIVRLAQKQVPTTITKLYENLAKYTQPAIDSLFKLKEKIKESPSDLDDYCFEQGVTAIETFAHYLLGIVDELKK
ncbi:hypothetical protein IJ674_09920 [bacterium]|nr:hypothetical protein [bacterium]